MPQMKRALSDDDSGEELESITSARSIMTDSSVHTDDTGSSCDEILDEGGESRAEFYKYPMKNNSRGSEDPMPRGNELYSVVCVGNLHIGIPEPTQPMPDKCQDWSVLHDTKNNEYISALRVKKDEESRTQRYYVLTNFELQRAAISQLYTKGKLNQCTVANLSLGVHGLTTEEHDATLLEHADLQKFKRADGKIIHIFDTPYAKRLMSRAAKAAKTKAKRKADAGAQQDDPKPKKKKLLVPEKPEQTPKSPKKSPKKSPPVHAVGTTPTSAPPVQSKQSKLKPVGRKLNLDLPSPKPSPAKGSIKLATSASAFEKVAHHIQEVINLLGIKVE